MPFRSNASSQSGEFLGREHLALVGLLLATDDAGARGNDAAAFAETPIASYLLAAGQIRGPLFFSMRFAWHLAQLTMAY